jgi:hypothetical protein
MSKTSGRHRGGRQRPSRYQDGRPVYEKKTPQMSGEHEGSIFSIACEMAKARRTRRQLSKWRLKRGKAYKFHRAAKELWLANKEKADADPA